MNAGDASARDFFDSNVLLYQFERNDSLKREIATRLVITALSDESAAISFQVVQEVLNGLVHKFRLAASLENAREVLEHVLQPMWRVMPSRALYEHALDAHERYRYSFYDSLIIAAALEAGCTRLLTEDLQDGQRIETLTITNPFASA